MYTAIFPLDIDDNNTYTHYDISVVTDLVGVVSPHWWHAPVKDYTTPEEGLRSARKILKAFLQRKKCPCEKDQCRRIDIDANRVHSKPVISLDMIAGKDVKEI